MPKIKRWGLAALSVFRLAGLGLGALAVVFGLFQDVSGGTTFWSLTPANWINVGVVVVALFGVATLIRHEYALRGFGELYGNEHARKLLSDGIPPYRDIYFRYVRQGDYAIVNRFWLAGLVNFTESGGRTDLHVACESGHAAIARGIIERGGDPKRPDDQGLTPLMVAANRGHLKVAEVLFEHDPAINAVSSQDGVSALYAASANGHNPMVELLIRFGANVDRLDHDSMTPLMAAIGQHKWDIARILIAAGADLRRVDKDGATLLDYIENRNAPDDILQKIRDSGVSYREPRLRITGSGHSGTGKVRMKWERASAAEVRKKTSQLE